MLLTRRIIAGALVVAVLVGGWSFAHLHREVVTIHFGMGAVVQLPLWQVLVGTFLAGILFSGFFASFALLRARLVARRYRATVKKLEEEVHQLRNLPLAADEALRSDDATRVVATEEAVGRDG